MTEPLKIWLSALPADRKRAIRRLTLVNAVRRIRKKYKGNLAAAINELAECRSSSRAMLYIYEKDADCTLKSQYPTLAQLVALLPRYGNRKAETHAFDADAIDWALGKFCEDPQTNVPKIYAELKSEAARRGWSIGSCDTLYRIIGK